jgi:hypothetical protein
VSSDFRKGQGAPTPKAGAPTLKVGARTPKAGAPTLKVGARTPKAGAPTPKAGAPTLKVGARTPKAGLYSPQIARSFAEICNDEVWLFHFAEARGTLRGCSFVF